MNMIPVFLLSLQSKQYNISLENLEIIYGRPFQPVVRGISFVVATSQRQLHCGCQECARKQVRAAVQRGEPKIFLEVKWHPISAFWR